MTQASFEELAEFAGNRTELYDKLATVLDLPALTPVVTLDYLYEIIKPRSSYFKIEREKTRTLPIVNYKRRFDAKQTLKVLE